MRLITARTVERYAERHAGAAQALSDWCAMVEAARWADADQVRASSTFPARPVGGRRIVFNVKGNHYRIICDIRYADVARGLNGIVRVQFVGTHAEYNAVDPEAVTLDVTRP